MTRPSLSLFSSRPLSKRKILMASAASIVAVVLLSTALYYFSSIDNAENPNSYRRILDTGSVPVWQYQKFYSQYFVVNGSEWYIKWIGWEPEIPEGTQLEIVVRDAYTNLGKGVVLLDMNGTDHFDSEGVFYLDMSVWPFSRTMAHIPVSFNATLEVWEAET